VEEYAAKTEKLAVQLTELVALGLGLDATTFSRHFAESTTSTVRMNFYPPCPQPSRALGISPHSDFNIFTILLHDAVPGLQVLKDGEWITVQPRPDALVVNVGDTFQVRSVSPKPNPSSSPFPSHVHHCTSCAQAWSNGRVRSVMHRALVNSTEPRLTVVHFFGPHPDAVIAPPAALVDDLHPLQYRAFAYKEMVEQIMHIRGKKVFQSPLNSFLL
jgi:isopenicillin N synthase-like dioxygenase